MSGLSPRLGPPPHHKPLVAGVVVAVRALWVEDRSCADDAFTQDLQLDISQQGKATPCYRDGPERGSVQRPAFNGGEVWVRRGKEVERYTRGEDCWGQWVDEECGEER